MSWEAQTRRYEDLDYFEKRIIDAVIFVSRPNCKEWYLQKIQGKQMWYVRCSYKGDVMSWNVTDKGRSFDVRPAAGTWVSVSKDSI